MPLPELLHHRVAGSAATFAENDHHTTSITDPGTRGTDHKEHGQVTSWTRSNMSRFTPFAVAPRTTRHVCLSYSARVAVTRQSPLQRRGYAAKGAEGKDDLNPTSTEHMQTDGGDAGAAHSSDAFDPSQTRPEHEGKSGEVSGANPAVNRTKQEETSATGKSAEEAGEGTERGERESGRGTVEKSGGGKYGGTS